MVYSNHAVKRMQQRGISNQVADILLCFGSRKSDHHGATIVFLSKQDLTKIKYMESEKIYRRLVEKPIYAIEKTGLVITVGHRYKRIVR